MSQNHLAPVRLMEASLEARAAGLLLDRSVNQYSQQALYVEAAKRHLIKALSVLADAELLSNDH